MQMYQRHKTKFVKERHREGLIHMAGASIPPWTTSISSRPPRPFLPKTTFHQVPSPSKDTLPLPPDDSAQPTAQPTIQVLKNPLHLRKAEVITPPNKKWSQALNEPLHIPAPTHSKCNLELRPKTTHRLRSHPQTWQLMPRHRVTQKRPVPRPVNHRFLLIDLQPHPLLKKASNRSKHTLPSRRRLNINVHIIGVPAESMTSTFQLPIQVIQQNIR